MPDMKKLMWMQLFLKEEKRLPHLIRYLFLGLDFCLKFVLEISFITFCKNRFFVWIFQWFWLIVLDNYKARKIKLGTKKEKSGDWMEKSYSSTIHGKRIEFSYWNWPNKRWYEKKDKIVKITNHSRSHKFFLSTFS